MHVAWYMVQGVGRHACRSGYAAQSRVRCSLLYQLHTAADDRHSVIPMIPMIPMIPSRNDDPDDPDDPEPSR